MHGDSRSEARMIAFTDPRFAAHAPLGFHPERPERLESAERGLARVTAPALQRVQGVPRDATRAELSRVHGERYLDKLESVLLDRGAGFLDGDTYYGPHSRKAAWLAAGSGCALVEARGEVTRGGGKTIFVRGLITGDGKPALSFTGIIRRLAKR